MSKDLIVVELGDLESVLSGLGDEQKEALAAKLLSSLPESSKARVIKEAGACSIFSYGQGSIVNHSSYQINAPSAGEALEMLIKLRKIQRGQD